MGNLGLFVGGEMCFPALVLLPLSVGVENGGEEGRRGCKAPSTKGAAGICVTRAILRLFVRLESLHPSLNWTDAFQKISHL